MSRFFHLAKRCTKADHTLHDGMSAATLTLNAAPTGTFKCKVKIATRPYYTTNLTGNNNDITWTQIGGTDSSVTIRYVDPGLPNQSLSISVSSNDITVNLATNSLSAITTTASDIVALVALDASLEALGVTATLKTGDTGAGVVTALTPHAHFTLGLDVAGTITVGSDVLTFTAAGTKLTSTNLTSLPVITTGNLDCYILITALDSGGNPIQTSTETDLPCTIKLISRGVQASDGTWASVKSTEIRARGSFDVGDIIKFDIHNFFDPTDGIEHPVTNWRPDKGLMGRENIKILEF